MTDKRDKLKPCPFCGCKAHRDKREKDYFKLNHKKECLLDGMWPYVRDQKDVIDAWNRRANETRH